MAYRLIGARRVVFGRELGSEGGPDLWIEPHADAEVWQLDGLDGSGESIWERREFEAPSPKWARLHGGA